MRREEAARAGERLASLAGLQPAHQAELRRLQAELGALFTAYLQRRGPCLIQVLRFRAELRRLQAELGALFTAYLQRRGPCWIRV